MCSSLIILVMSCQMYLWSPGNGRGSLATFRLSRWHIVITQNYFPPVLSLKVAECRYKPSRKTCAGPSCRSAIEGRCAMWSMLCIMHYDLVMHEWSHLLVKWLLHVYMPSPTHTAPNPSCPFFSCSQVSLLHTVAVSSTSSPPLIATARWQLWVRVAVMPTCRYVI